MSDENQLRVVQVSLNERDWRVSLWDVVGFHVLRDVVVGVVIVPVGNVANWIVGLWISRWWLWFTDGSKCASVRWLLQCGSGIVRRGIMQCGDVV